MYKLLVLNETDPANPNLDTWRIGTCHRQKAKRLQEGMPVVKRKDQVKRTKITGARWMPWLLHEATSLFSATLLLQIAGEQTPRGEQKMQAYQTAEPVLRRAEAC